MEYPEWDNSCIHDRKRLETVAGRLLWVSPEGTHTHLSVTDVARLRHYGYDVSPWLDICAGCSDRIRIAFGDPSRREMIGFISYPYLSNKSLRRYFLDGPAVPHVEVREDARHTTEAHNRGWLAWYWKAHLGEVLIPPPPKTSGNEVPF